MIITYNGYTISEMIGKLRYSENEKQISVSCEFLVLSTSESLLIADCQTVEQKLTEKNKDFSFSLGGSTEFNLSHSGNTGFLAQPSLSKMASEYTTGTSRHYSFSLSIQLPFDQSPYNYRREASFSISYASTRQRTVSFSVLYTAGGANSALQNYLAFAKTWCVSILTALGGSYELVSESHNLEMEQKILNGSLSYREIITNQSKLLTDEPAFVDFTASYSVQVEQQIGFALTANQTQEPLVHVTCGWSTSISHDETPLDTNLDALYTSKIRPWLVEHAKDVVGLSSIPQSGTNGYIIDSESKSYNVHRYSLSGNISFTAPRSLSQNMELSESISFQNDENISSDKLWSGVDHDYNLWSIGKTLSATRNISISKLNEIPVAPPDYAGAFSESANGGKWIKKSSSERVSAKKIGVGTTVNFASSAVIYTKSWSEIYLFVLPSVGNNSVLIQFGAAD
jgi:hypothetical protein